MTTSGYQLRKISGPESFPVTLEEARLHCKIDADLRDDDVLVQDWIEAATELAESYTKRSFCERTYELLLDSFPRCPPYQEARVFLPFGPVIELVSVQYLDTDGSTVDQDLAALHFAQYDEPAWIGLGNNGSWPMISPCPGAVKIQYRAGYASAGSPADAATVPRLVKQAIRMLVSHWNENREAAGKVEGEIAYAFERCLQPLRFLP